MGRGNLPPKGRTWVIEPDPTTGIIDEEAIGNALAEAALIVDRLGGVVQLAANRAELPEEVYGVPGIFATQALMIQWSSYAPAQRPPPPPAPEQEPVEEPVAAVTG